MMRIFVVRSAPYLADQLAVCQQPVRMDHKSFQQTVLCRRQRHVRLAESHDPFRKIDREIAYHKYGFGVWAMGAAQRGSHARPQLTSAKRLGEVVVGAGVKRGDLRGLLSLN